VKIIDCKQGSPEWFSARCGIPTASEFHKLISPTLKTRTGEGVHTYMVEKLAEKFLRMPISDIRGQFIGNFAMAQGSMLEHEAIPWVELVHDLRIDRVGFCTTDDGRIGCSPDGLIGDDCGIEVKCPQPDTHLGYLIDGVVPDQYLAQVYGSMFVTGRSSWYFLSYSRQFPALLVRVERDEKIMAAIKHALDIFLESFDANFADVSKLRDAENAIKQRNYEEANK
jgi:hypothetical protein